ncbi:hypothetical protein B5X24_HaOG213059 [Helicoverpa armigera]|nr:hypothetical protein B5X24_HaOG213059 [Helicoverpa armigera]
MDNTMDAVKKICPNCSQFYYIILTSSKLKGNLPLFLSCGHTMCENCIVNIMKCMEPIECKVCLRDIDLQGTNLNELLQDKSKLYQKFPVNVQMAGELTVNLMMMASNSTQKKTEEDSFINLKDLITSDVTQGNCLECNVVTSKMCKECVTILCDACFHKTHKNFVIFKNHVLQPIESAAQPVNCKLHLGKPLEYYCKDCEKAICTDCMILGGEKSCKNHEVVSLQEVNETFLEELSEWSPKVDETLRRLTKTAVINLPSLLEEAKQIANSPWYLNRKEANSESLKVTVNEDLCSLISDYVHLEGNVKSVYKLYSTSEIGDDVEIPPPPNSLVYPPELPKDARLSSQSKPKEPQQPYKFAPKYRSKSGSVSSLNSSCSETSTRSYLTQNSYVQQPVVQPVAPFQENLRPQQLSEGSQELIYISHIVDPHNFFVQRACFQGLIKDMVREFRNAVSFVKPSVNHITPGKTYLAFNKADNMWQRCRVIDTDTKNNKTIVQVFCFDFGSIEFVSPDRLRILPPSQCSYPLAINCSLANCVPKTGAWTSEDSFLIQNIIDNKQAVIHIRSIKPLSNGDFQLDCDVTTFENGINLARALVFHDRAKMMQPNLPYPKIMGLKEKPKLFTRHNEFRNDTPEFVWITHVVSPDKFFVRKQHLQEVYEKLTEDLEQEYSLASKVGTVYLPEIGMVCAVNLENCRDSVPETAWARGIVSELPGRGRVRVTLPDSGHEVLVHWTALRYIRPNFTKLSALATECYLAGITPLNKKWKAAAVDLLQKYTGNMLELKVEDNRNKGERNRGSIGVTLYDHADDHVACINNEMIKHRFAVSFGVYGFNQNPVEEQVRTNKSPLAQPKPPVPKTSQVRILNKQTPKKVNEDDLQAKDKGPLRLEVKILNYQSPSLIYVSLVHQQKSFNELFEKMQKYYSKNIKGKENWKVGEKCGAFCLQSQTWRRAYIMELENDTAKVFYSDFAFTETIPKTSLKELTSEFSSFGDAAIKCHLCGIMPAVGDEWPLITKEYLKELIDAYKRIFITKLGNFKDNSMPIQLWVYHTVHGGALEPNKSTWRCLNNKILEQGLCVPDHSQVVAADSITEDNGDTLSFLNITGSVNEWLQLEPVPMVPLKTIKTDDEANEGSSSPFLEGEDSDGVAKPGQSSNILYITDWLPPEPLPYKEFTALPTYIDNDGVIYLHDVNQQDTLDLIRKALDVRFKAPDPKAKFTKWSVGEPCAAQFFLDNLYYRVNGVLPIELKYDKLLINEHLVDFEMAEYIDGTKPVEVRAFASKKKTNQTVKEEVVESDSSPDYIVVDDTDTNTITDQLSTSKESLDNSLKGIDWNKIIDAEESIPDENYITYPKDIKEEFECNITVINDIKALELNVIADDDTTKIYEQMFEDLQAESMNGSPLNGIFENKACVAVFPEDGRWYRASILQYKILEEWATLPPATVTAKLFGVQVNPDVSIGDITKEYAKIFLDQGPFHVKVMGYDESVPLVELRNDKQELVYKKLIEDKIFIMCH